MVAVTYNANKEIKSASQNKKICLMKECKKTPSKWLLNQDYVR